MSVALNFTSLILPLILFTFLFLKKTVWMKLSKFCCHHHRTSSFDEHPLEQRSHYPHIPQIGYVIAEGLLQEDNSIS